MEGNGQRFLWEISTGVLDIPLEGDLGSNGVCLNAGRVGVAFSLDSDSFLSTRGVLSILLLGERGSIHVFCLGGV